jgi:hypothetical protein
MVDTVKAFDRLTAAATVRAGEHQGIKTHCNLVHKREGSDCGASRFELMCQGDSGEGS